MKRIVVFLLICFLVLTFAGRGRDDIARQQIFDLVEENYDAILRACEARDTDALLAMEGISKVNIVDGYVLIYCQGAGIAPSSQDYGFYYSRENLPVAVDCNLCILCSSAELTPEGNGYQYVSYGNIFYTEPIEGKFYFYSAAY